MPEIYVYKCNLCGFSFPTGWGGYMYVEVDEPFLNSRLAEISDQIEKIQLRIKEIEQNKRLVKNALELIFHKNEQVVEIFREITELKDTLSTLEYTRTELKNTLALLKREKVNQKRIVCPHPSEFRTLEIYLGKNFSSEVYRNRIGFNSYCVCLDCLHQFTADFRDEDASFWRKFYGFFDRTSAKDERKCPKCGSTNVRTVSELVSETCPKCKKGTIVKLSTGIIS